MEQQAVFPTVPARTIIWACRRLVWTAAVTIFAWAFVYGCSTVAQTPENGTVVTLHAYTNLTQVATLVLGRDRKPIAPIDERKFFVSLGGGPRLRVTHARLEGDDPISLSILLDLSQSNPSILLQADQAIASLAPLSLHAEDQVTIYALECKLVRSTDQGATDAATLKRHVDLVLQQWQSRGQRSTKGTCQNPSCLRDSLATLVDALSRQPGRRVILAVTDGLDRGSQHSWIELKDFAQIKSVAIFGLIPADIVASTADQQESPINILCEVSGGMVLPTAAQDLGKQLAWAVTLVRGRYIVEFPRPSSKVAGQYDLRISVLKTSAIIRPTGAVFPIDDPAILNDPTTVPSDPSRAPQLGKRRILVPR